MQPTELTADELASAEAQCDAYNNAKTESDAARLASGLITWTIPALLSHADALQAKVVHAKGAYSKMNEEVCQTLGAALGMPRFCDDQANFPGTTEADGVCVGDHVAETLAMEAARRIAELQAQVARLEGLALWHPVSEEPKEGARIIATKGAWSNCGDYWDGCIENSCDRSSPLSEFDFWAYAPTKEDSAHVAHD